MVITETKIIHISQPKSPLTWRIVMVVICVSFGTWFPIGYSMSIMNAPQWRIVHWIRGVKCNRLPSLLDPDSGMALQAATNYTYGYATDSDYLLWCGHINREDSNRLLGENSELNSLWAIAASILPLGCFVTVWFTNTLLGRYGSKKTLLVNNLVGVIGALLCYGCVWTDSYEVLIFGRIVLGMNVGLVMAIVPLYVAEISPTESRGTLGTIPGFMLVSGSLAGILLGLPQCFGEDHSWPLLSVVLLVPFGLLFVSLPFFPESPRFLFLTKDDRQHAARALQWFRMKSDVQEELKIIQQEGDEHHEVMSVTEMLADRVARSTVLLCAALIISQQFSGISAIILYSTGIFLTTGLGKMESLYGTIGLMVLQVASVFTSSLLMDRAGRKLLLLVGMVGSMLCCVGMVTFMTFAKIGNYHWAQYACIGCIVLFMLAFNIGPAFVPWILVSEMFEKRCNGAAMMVVSSTSHISGLIVAFTFPILQAAVEEWVFAGFALSLAFFSVFVYFRVIETKGRTFEEIQAQLRKSFDK